MFLYIFDALDLFDILCNSFKIVNENITSIQFILYRLRSLCIDFSFFERQRAAKLQYSFESFHSPRINTAALAACLTKILYPAQ